VVNVQVITGHRARRLRRSASVVLASLLGSASLLGLVTNPVSAESPAQEPSLDDPAQQLVERFAPVMMLKQQDDECDAGGEQFRPSSVDVVLDNPEVALVQVGRNDIVAQRAPGAADLAGLGEGFYLDFPGSSLSPGCIFERDFRKYAGDLPAAIYAHIVYPPDAPDRLVVQYWFYWYYNDWNNKHESDWEGIALLFEASSIEDALRSQPIEVGYSQHEGGERSEWSDAKLEREGDHPIVYSSSGSHASYFDSAIFLGRGAAEGFGCDNTTGPSDRVAPEVVLLPDSVDDPDDPLAWLGYQGRWGERQGGANNGPTGPAGKDRWLDPLPWFEELRDQSVVIPANDTEGASVIDTFCDLVERGAHALITFNVSPFRVLLGLLAMVLAIRFVVGRTDWTRVEADPLRRRRAAGQIIRASAATYRATPLAFIAIGLLYIPAALVAGLLAAIASVIPLIGEFLSLAQPSRGANIFVALLAGSAAHPAAFVAVNALVATYGRGDERGVAGAVAAARTLRGKWRVLFGAFVRAYVTVVALGVTVIGIPWAIRQTVRYQLIAHAIAHENADAKGALRRSSELVKGRWLRTAFVTMSLHGIVFLTAMAVSMPLLLAFTSIPLWLFSILVSLVYVFVVPLAAIAMNLLYGDAVAASEGAPRAELVSVD
jgi:hypothetical protein